MTSFSSRDAGRELVHEDQPSLLQPRYEHELCSRGLAGRGRMTEPVQYFLTSGRVLVGRARELKRVIGIPNDTTITKPELRRT